ncbi:hypothetical protein [Sphingomonas carotinifaciens]|uniref:hypothetical protein n=1 Tax=Sphingomonas carotinifaciens TaxID=1166323 RepID=UPI001374A586|nr:hypothetical protein [Sphingomonas carotinifaciens]
MKKLFAISAAVAALLPYSASAQQGNATQCKIIADNQYSFCMKTYFDEATCSNVANVTYRSCLWGA